MADTPSIVKAEASSPTPANGDSGNDIDAKILKQLEFYFSDSNFPKDKFLRSQAQQNPEGYVSIEKVAGFNRMRQLCTDLEVITNALKKSKTLKVSDDGKMVKRLNPLPEQDTSDKRTIYSKGWPADTTIEKVEKFYAPHGQVQSVRLRKRKDKSFKGSVLVEFAREEEARATLDAAPQPEGCTLIYQTKEQWQQEKREQMQKFMKEKKEKREQEKQEKKRKAKELEQEEENSFRSGLILSFKDMGDGMKPQTLKPIFEEYGEVAFVDLPAGASNGFVRFKTPEAASKALKELQESKREIGGKVPSFDLLAGDEEKQYWQMIISSSKGKKGQKQKGKKGGKGKRQRTG